MEEKDRIRLFFVCVLARIGLAVLVYYNTDTEYSKYLAVLLFVMALGFLTRAIMRDTGVVPDKGFTGGDVYWNSYVHSLIYATAAVSLYANYQYTFMILVFDLVYGIIVFLDHYYLN